MVVNFRDIVQEPTEVSHPAQAASSPTPQQLYFLDRLSRLTRKSVILSRYLVPTDRRMRLLNHAVIATYDDCRTLDVATEARAIIEEIRRDALAPLR